MIYLVTTNPFLKDCNLYKIISIEKSLELLNKLSIIGVDTETSGLDCWTNELLLVQLGNFDFQVVIDCRTIDITFYKSLLEDPTKEFLGWNLGFDLKFFYRHHIILQKVYDGFLAEKLLWLGYPAGMHSLSLKAAGHNYCNIELDKSVRGKIIWSKTLTDDIIEYGALDVKYLEKIKDAQYKLLKEKQLLTAIKYENAFIRALAYMEYCGIKLDENRWKSKMISDQNSLDRSKATLNKWVEEHYGDDPSFCKIDLQGYLWTGFDTNPKCIINWNSPQQVIKILEKEGLDLNTKEGKSVDSKVLKPQKDKSELVPIYLEFRKQQKVVSTYGQNFLDQINPTSKRIHTRYSAIGADTTRITSGGKDKGNGTEYVNLLNIPSDPETRACFVAERGNKWISIDYTGQESFLMASIANDEAMINELMYGEKDLHTLTAKLVFDYIPKEATAKEVKERFHKERSLAKGYEFAFNYAGNSSTIQRNFGLSEEEATRIYNAYMEGFEGLKKYQQFRKKDWWDKGYILLSPITGHKAFIYDYQDLKTIQADCTGDFWTRYKELKKTNPNALEIQKVRKLFKRRADSDRQSVNYPIQAAGSMCLRVTMINFFNWIVKNNLFDVVKICVAPYDEVNCEAPEEIALDVANVLYSCMKKAGEVFCTRCTLDAEISWDKDFEGNTLVNQLPTYWIH